MGFSRFAALPESRLARRSRLRILSGDQEMIAWWSIGAGVHVESHSHANEQIVWMLKGRVEFPFGTEQRVCGRGDVVVIPGGTEHEAWFPRRHRGDRFLRASARRLPTRWQTRLHEQRLNRSLRLLTDRAHQSRGARDGRGSSLESKHSCRLGGDRANRFRPPRADDHSVTSN